MPTLTAQQKSIIDAAARVLFGYRALEGSAGSRAHRLLTRGLRGEHLLHRDTRDLREPRFLSDKYISKSEAEQNEDSILESQARKAKKSAASKKNSYKKK